MDFAARLMCQSQQDLQERVENPKKATSSMEVEDEIWIHIPSWAHKWKRILMMLMLVTRHSETGLMIQYLEKMRQRKAQEALEEYVRCAGTDAKTPKKAVRKSEGPMPMAKGKALSRSKAVKNPLDPELCQHKDEDLSHPRGGRNQTFWITCLRCGSRWERVQAPPSPPCSSGSAKVMEEEFVKVEAPMTGQQQRQGHVPTLTLLTLK